MPESISSSVQMCAGDTKIFRQITGLVNKVTLQDDLDQLDKWAQQWQLSFNVDKCKILHLDKTNGKTQYKRKQKFKCQNSPRGNRRRKRSRNMDKQVTEAIQPCSLCHQQSKPVIGTSEAKFLVH